MLADCITKTQPLTAALTYEFGPREGKEGPELKSSDYVHRFYGARDPEVPLKSWVRQRLPVQVLPALRDAESDLAAWRRSPLRPLLEKCIAGVPHADLEAIAREVDEARKQVAAVPAFAGLATQVSNELASRLGQWTAPDISLGVAPVDAKRLVRNLRLLLDEGRRGIDASSLGIANVIYVALRSMELAQRIDENEHDHAFLVIEEPEAHLHPHLQRLVYRAHLDDRDSDRGDESQGADEGEGRGEEPTAPNANDDSTPATGHGSLTTSTTRSRPPPGALDDIDPEDATQQPRPPVAPRSLRRRRAALVFVEQGELLADLGRRARHDLRPRLGVAREHPVIPNHVKPGRRNQRGIPCPSQPPPIEMAIESSDPGRVPLVRW